MKLAGAFLVLLSAAALLWCDSKANPLPSKVIINCDVFYGDKFKDKIGSVDEAKSEIRKTFKIAQNLLNKFTAKFGTTIELKEFSLRSYKDPSFDFGKAVKHSKSNGKRNANMFIYFSRGKSNKYPILRKEGLRSRMCHADKGYRTLLLNKAKAVRHSLARIIAYYVGTLIGMQYDNSNGCSDGIMDYDYWHRRDNLHWNKCNANDFYWNFVKREKLECIISSPDTLIIYCDVFYGNTFVNEIGNVDEAKSEIKETFKKAQELLSKFSKFGTTIKLNMLSLRSYDDTSFDFKEAVKNSIGSENVKANMYIHFTHGGTSTVLRKLGLKSEMCDADVSYRTFVLNKAKANRHSLARIIAYYVGTLMGIRNDESNPKECQKGIMYYTWWHSRSSLRWNKCNAEDFRKFFTHYRNTCIKPHIPRMLTVPLEFFYDAAFMKSSWSSTGTKGTHDNVVKDVNQLVKKMSEYFNKDGSLGIQFRFNVIGITYLNKNILYMTRNQGSNRANFYIYLVNFPGLISHGASDNVGDSICTNDKIHKHTLLSGANRKYTVARQMTYIIARSLGINYDKGRRDKSGNKCADGFMKDVLTDWRIDTRIERWNKCNAEDLEETFFKTPFVKNGQSKHCLLP